jgi:hypothetical protein
MILFIALSIWIVGVVVFFSLLFDFEEHWWWIALACLFWPLGLVIAAILGVTGTLSEFWVWWRSRRQPPHSPDEVHRE